VAHRKRSLLAIAAEKPRRVTQVLAVDEFGELAARKRTAAAAARQRGHQMAGWHRRKNDTAGRWNAYCTDCNAAAVVCTEAPDGMPDSYGDALRTECSGKRREGL
jgi:hypothetical protein